MKAEIQYAPRDLNEVIYPNVAVERRIKGYAAGGLEGHVMLFGPNGTGKSTVARLLAQSIGGEDAMMDSPRPAELLARPDLQGYLQRSAAVARLTTSGKYFLLLHEFDNVHKGVDNFWTALDACGDGLMVIITTNKPMDIHPSIRSRMDLIEMRGIAAAAVLPRVQQILLEEGLHLPDRQLLSYLTPQEHFGDLRKYLKVADELLYLHRSGLPIPGWKLQPPKFQLV